MKIALVSFRNDSSCPPLGLVQLGTYLQIKGHRVNLIDFNYSDTMCYGDTTYDAIGISAMTKDYGRAIHLANRIRKYKVTLNCQPRANLMTDDMCKALKNVGVKTCIFGFESGNQKILSYLKKDTVTVEDNYNAIRQCKKYGLGVQGSVIFGSPCETKGDMLDTLTFIKNAFRMGVERIWGFVLTPFPATEVWRLLQTKVTDWNKLSHQNTTPYFGDSTIQEFNQIMKKLKQYELLFKIRKALMFLGNNPIQTIKYFITHNSIVRKLSKQNV